jgi:hypothetical protein
MRDDFPAAVKQTLAHRVGLLCSNPQCRASTIGPRLNSSETINVGVAAHICAASPEGPRYDPVQSQEQRRSLDNGIWLCQTCAKLIDSDVTAFTPAVLQSWKRQAEADARLRLGKATNAAGSLHRFSEEEIELLINAADRGEFVILSSDQTGKWVRAGASDFVNIDDPEVAARYFEAFESLRVIGVIRYEAGDLYVLTGRGFKVARQLKAERQ